MDDRLYFLRELAGAYALPDPRLALRDSLERLAYPGVDEPVSSEARLFLAELGKAIAVDLIVRREGKSLATVALLPDGSDDIITGVTPGWFTIETATGWTLWEGRLSPGQLLRDVPAESLPAAAATEQKESIPSLSVTTGDLLISVYPGVASGSLLLRWS